MKIFCSVIALSIILGSWLISLPVLGANSPRRSVECRVFSKLYATLHDRVKSLDQVGVAQQFMSKLENDIGALSLEDSTLKQIQTKYVRDFHEMSLVFKNIREGQLVGDEKVLDRMMPYFQTTSESINSNTKELNGFCKGVWGFKPIG